MSYFLNNGQKIVKSETKLPSQIKKKYFKSSYCIVSRTKYYMHVHYKSNERLYIKSALMGVINRMVSLKGVYRG